jgi:hypothetical protein
VARRAAPACILTHFASPGSDQLGSRVFRCGAHPQAGRVDNIVDVQVFPLLVLTDARTVTSVYCNGGKPTFVTGQGGYDNALAVDLKDPNRVWRVLPVITIGGINTTVEFAGVVSQTISIQCRHPSECAERRIICWLRPITDSAGRRMCWSG